jgi:hypothetical protein
LAEWLSVLGAIGLKHDEWSRKTTLAVGAGIAIPKEGAARDNDELEAVCAFDQLCQTLADILGLQPDDIKQFTAGLLGKANGPAGKYLPVATKLRELDHAGVTERLWKHFCREHGQLFNRIKVRLKSQHAQASVIWFHGDRSYSLDRTNPKALSMEKHHALQAFLESGTTLRTRDLTKAGVNNPAKIMRLLESDFPGAIRRPAQKRDGYYARVKKVGRG